MVYRFFLLLCPLVLFSTVVLADESTKESKRLNIVLISIDTLRADRLGVYGYDRNTSPVLDSLAREGAVFQNTISESPWTLPSHTTMMSGQRPSVHGVVLQKDRIRESTPLLAEQLRKVGYRTYGFADGAFLRSRYGFSRGFDVYESERRGTSHQIARAKHMLAKHPEENPFFLFLHTYDVHCPYSPPESYYGQFQSDGAEHVPVKGKCGDELKPESMSQENALYVSDRYDDGLRWVDHQIGQFLKLFRDMGVYENTAFIVTSDHGEELFERGRFGHKRTLHTEVLRIPLIIRIPGAAMRRVSDHVGLSNVAPTILEIAGAPALPEADSSVLCLAVGSRCKEPHLDYRISELDRHITMRSVIKDDYHLIFTPQTDRTQLYSIKTDPDEKVDLAMNQKDRVQKMLALIKAHVASDAIRLLEKEEKEEDAGVSEELEALGYMQ